MHKLDWKYMEFTCWESFDLKASLRISTALDGSTYFLFEPTKSANRYLNSRMKGRFLCSCMWRIQIFNKVITEIYWTEALPNKLSAIIIIYKVTSSTTKVMLHDFYLPALQNNAVLWEENPISETQNSLKSYLDDNVCLEVGLNWQLDK